VGRATQENAPAKGGQCGNFRAREKERKSGGQDESEKDDPKKLQDTKETGCMRQAQKGQGPEDWTI